MKRLRAFFILALLFASPVLAETKTSPPQQTRMDKLPTDFIENRGQWETSAKFAVCKGKWTAVMEKNAVALRAGREASLRLVFEGASEKAELAGEGKRDGRYNFFVGNDPKHWRADVPAFQSILYRGLYRGVDARVREEAGQLEYDLLLEPGADLEAVRILAEGADEITIADDGALLIRIGEQTLRQAPPRTWEILADGTTRPIECRFRKIDDCRYGFATPQRDPRLAMTIDPGLEWSTFLGGGGTETITGMELARDGSGDLILSGQTESADFPHTNGHHTPVGYTPYVARMNASGSALVYCTFFGGSFNHSVLDLAVDAQSQPVIVGDTNSTDFPTTPGAYDQTPPDGWHGDYDAFVIKFNSTGSAIVFGTYLGSQPGSMYLDQAWAVALDAASNVIVAGVTTGETFPTTAGAYDRTANVYVDNSVNPPQRSVYDVFISRLNPTGSALTYSTFFGGQGIDYVYNLVLDSQGVVTITGKTSQLANRDINGNEIPFGTPMPTTAGAFDTTYNGGSSDAYIARFKLDGAGAADLKYASFLGGQQYTEAGASLALNPANEQEVTVTGFTRSGDFPTTAGAFSRTHFAPVDGSMAFVTRFNFASPTNGSLVWSTFYGAVGGHSAEAVVIDSEGAAIFAGSAGSTNPVTTERAFDRVPVKHGAYDRTPAGYSAAYLARISADGSQLLYASLLGGSAGEGIAEMALVSGHTVVVAGTTYSHDFPVTPGAFDKIFSTDGRPGEADIFISRFTLESNDSGDITPPPAPAPIAPGEASSFTAPIEVTLDWSDVTDESGIEAYHVQVSPNSTFTQDAGSIAGTFHENWHNVSYAVVNRSVSNTGTMYWRVRALDGAHNMGPWSAVRTFTVQSPTPPAQVILSSPANGGRYAPGNVTFAWNPAARAQYYQLEVDTVSNFSNPGRTSLRAITSTQHTLSFTTERTYWWRVRASNASFTDGAWSSARSFEIKRGSPPAPVPPPPSPTPAPGGASGYPVTITVNPASIYGGTTAQGTATLQNPAPAGGAVVELFSHDPLLATVPPSVTIPAGTRSANFTVTGTPGIYWTGAVGIAGRYQGITHGQLVMVFADRPYTPLYSFTLSPTTVTGGSAAQGTVALTPGWTAPPEGLVVTLASTDPQKAAVPASVMIPGGANSATFAVTTQSTSAQTTATIIATRGDTMSATLTINPPGPPPPPAIYTIEVLPATVNGGSTSEGTAWINAPAPTGGVVVSLFSGNTNIATVPASATVPAGAQFVRFTVTTKPVATSTTVPISGTAGGVTKSVTLGVDSTGQPPPSPTPPPPSPTPPPPTPTPAPAAAVSTITLNPASVTGGNTSQATVTLTSAAPAGGAVVSISRSNAAASVPASVNIPAGATSGAFTITTSSVSSTTSSVISATYNGITKSSMLTINPNAPAPSDTVVIQQVEYRTGSREFRLEATSSNSSAVMKAYVTSTNALIGTLSNNGGGRYSMRTTLSSNPQSVTVRSSLGGSATRTVTTTN